ncbi:MAG: NTP transferase domain-containing protein [Chloroflexota bacterium]|nr:NTP transferase domain-containing protein [Chloroflexota bacterium]
MSITQYPVFVMCGRDLKRRKLMDVVDPENQYKSKALLPFLGKRLIDWQLDELRQSPYVKDIYLLGLTEEDITLDFPVHYVPVDSTADVSVKFGAGVDYLSTFGPLPELVVISSCDAPGIRIDEIDHFFEAIADADGAEFVLSLVPEEIVEAVFPGAGRVTAHFRDGDVFPGELYALSPRLIRLQQEAIREMNQRRRKINRTKRKVGMGPIVRYLVRRPQTWSLLLRYGLGLATLADAERAVGAALGGKARGVIIPDVGFGMDMDLPEDYERLQDFVRRTKLS